ncbi:uncharacterized abhydrolase domain-containing protein DDB_G0269086 isoform X1 [Neodiprion lecontei]|uniref:Uncharacterized abhydrolase domain-containing protein DDB_G0269086 isoform X1 n=1 Tax=Neodiprion lecontei TaxID=441921 RepID=A0A6J0B3L1_NEOLC|nr:uncharacterized abhydrolase domain-containing protein DDB_G0269086 isoform X1 [Neodiprion lecontei]
MVYESDFYTTRRPYSRPLVSSYTVTSPTVLPLSSVIQVRSYPHMPYVAHKRLVTFVHTPVHTIYHTGTPLPIRIHSRVRPSVLAAEYNRIRDLPRSSSASYTERYLNSKDSILFDDEARQIRAKADALLRRIHVFVPRLPASDFHEDIVPLERLRSDDYIRRLLSARKNVQKEMELAPWYTVPEQRNLGKGHLASVQYVGGRPHSRRRPYFKVADLRPTDILNDVNLLSFYSKNRQAAAYASPVSPLTDREQRKARAVEPEWTSTPAPAPPQNAASPPPPEPEEPVVEKKKEKKEKKEKKKEKEDRMTAAEEEAALKRAEEFLAKQAEEARIEAERKLAAEQERLRLEREEEEARIALERAQEEAEAERKLEEARLEAERIEAERIAQEERLALEIAEIAAAEAEQERLALLKRTEEEHKKQQEEERLAAEAAAAAAEALAAEEAQLAQDALDEAQRTQQEQEERQDETIVDEEPQIDEVAANADDEANAGAETFVEEPVDVEGGDSRPEEDPVVDNDVPQIEEVTSGGEDIWGDKEDA